MTDKAIIVIGIPGGQPQILGTERMARHSQCIVGKKCE